jgi:hypothetical protein
MNELANSEFSDRAMGFALLTQSEVCMRINVATRDPNKEGICNQHYFNCFRSAHLILIAGAADSRQLRLLGM